MNSSCLVQLCSNISAFTRTTANHKFAIRFRTQVCVFQYKFLVCGLLVATPREQECDWNHEAAFFLSLVYHVSVCNQLESNNATGLILILRRVVPVRWFVLSCFRLHHQQFRLHHQYFRLHHQYFRFTSPSRDLNVGQLCT